MFINLVLTAKVTKVLTHKKYEEKSHENRNHISLKIYDF